MPSSKSKDLMYQPGESYAVGDMHPHTAASFFLRAGYMGRLNQLVAKKKIKFSESLYRYMDAEGTFSFDLIISSITENHSEFESMQPFIGEYFSQMFYGSKPMVVSVNAFLLETAENDMKRGFMNAYTEIFRVGSVARNKIAPSLWYNSTFLEGAMLNLNISENGENSELITLNFDYLVFSSFQEAHYSKGAFLGLSVDYFYPSYASTVTNPPPTGMAD